MRIGYILGGGSCTLLVMSGEPTKIGVGIAVAILLCALALTHNDAP